MEHRFTIEYSVTPDGVSRYTLLDADGLLPGEISGGARAPETADLRGTFAVSEARMQILAYARERRIPESAVVVDVVRVAS